MEKISNDYRENVRMLDGLLGVGRSCDMVSRDYLIGGRRARLWVVDGFGSDSILERMGAFWLTLKPENVVGLTEMQDFLDRYITFSESNVTFDISDAVTSVFLGKSLLAVEGLAGVALMDAKGYPSRSVHEPPDGKVLRGSHDGFVEAVVPNMALLRRRIRDPHLTMEGHKVGSRTLMTRSSAIWMTRWIRTCCGSSGASCWGWTSAPSPWPRKVWQRPSGLNNGTIRFRKCAIQSGPTRRRPASWRGASS